MLIEDYYKILNIKKETTTDEIKRAYRQLAKKYHPDVSEDPEAQEKFILITEAYEFLTAIELKGIKDEKKSHASRSEDEISEARERAKERARKKYERMKQQQEELKKSGIYDVLLVVKYLLSVALPFIALGLLIIPFYLMVYVNSFAFYSTLFIFWIAGFFLIINIYSNRRNYFRHGAFYYSFKDLKNLFNPKHYDGVQNCFYCKNYKANAKPYEISMLKILDVKLQRKGTLQNAAGYTREYKTITIPRSIRAFNIHKITSIIKFVSIVFCLLLLNIDSVLWRFILGIVIGAIGSSLLLLVTNTRSKLSFLYSWGLVIKIVIWLFVIIKLSYITNNNIYTNDLINPAIILLLLFDSIIEFFLRIISNDKLMKPIVKQPQELEHLFNEKYQPYLDAPLWSIIYPLFKWIFG